MVDNIQLITAPNTLVIINAKHNLHYHCVDATWNFWLFEFRTQELLFTPNKNYPLILDKTDLTLCASALDELKQEHLCGAGALFQALIANLLRNEPLEHCGDFCA